jgi:diguanylate cyclase (GGDEF)-like protein
MDELTKTGLMAQIVDLETQLERQKKINNALLARVKKNLKYQLNSNETFEHNSFLLNQIKQTKSQLLYETKTSERFSYIARHDSLTGLYNRVEFKKVLKRIVKSAQNQSKKHALMFLDLDQFKVINDTAGHLAGDEMIKQISTFLLKTVEFGETLARLGGDEFGFLIENCTQTHAQLRADKLLSLIDEFYFPWDDKLFTVSASIGIVIINQETVSHIEAQKNVDIACYAAKNAGRNRTHLYQEQDDKLLKQNAEMQWVPKLTNALENDLFCLYAQPIKPTSPKANHLHYEILVRLNDNNKVILPGVFLPPAERYNLITKIDAWIIKHTFQWLSEHVNSFHPRSHFSINLSGQSLGDDTVLKLIIRLLKNISFDGSRVHFEVTESMTISNLQAANEFIKKIKKFGCKFSLDDFGSGLSSLSYLKNLDVDTLKVDGVFIRDILDDPIDEEMVSSINNIGHVMGMKTVAEYVENKKTAEKLITMGFNYLQGNFIGKPKPVHEFLNDASNKIKPAL